MDTLNDIIHTIDNRESSTKCKYIGCGHGCVFSKLSTAQSLLPFLDGTPGYTEIVFPYHNVFKLMIFTLDAAAIKEIFLSAYFISTKGRASVKIAVVCTIIKITDQMLTQVHLWLRPSTFFFVDLIGPGYTPLQSMRHLWAHCF